MRADLKPRLGLATLAALSILWGAWWAINKAYAIDEFYYVHEAWQMLQPGHGLLEPLLHGVRFLPLYWYSPIIAIAQDKPEHMLWLRFEAILVWGAMLGLLARCAYLLSERSRLAAACALFMAAAARPLMWYAVELRPDPLAMTLTLASLWALLEAAQRARPKRWVMGAGLCLFLACCASFKAFVYGGPFAIAALFALPKRYRAHFEHPYLFSAIFGAGWVITAALVLGTGSGALFWEGLFGLIELHEEHYPKLDPWRLFTPMIQRYPWLIVVTMLGLSELGRDWIVSLKQRQGSPALLVLVVWVGAIASYFMQRGAYDYSLLPMLAMSCLIGAVGISALWRAARASILALEPSRRRALVVAFGAIMALWCYDIYRDAQGLPSNERQLEAQRKLGALTDPQDKVYDLSASYVFRPRAHRFAFVDRLRVKVFADELNQEVPKLLKSQQVALVIEDARFKVIKSKPLGKFIATHYQPYDGDFRIWGKQWKALNAPWQDKYWAIKDGDYFIHPHAQLTTGRLEVDGKPITTPTFKLKAGEHLIKWTPEGAKKRKALYMMWLPRDKKRFDPTIKRPPKRLAPWILPGGVQRED